ncbi:MAG: DUF2029 domain-containing protein [Saprospiraceae bacterium]|nr:DUF2029 domain-containing protein [Saprospiraceae bacterium]
MKEWLKTTISNQIIIASLYVLFALIASMQSLTGTKTYHEGGRPYNRYNNYTIFEKSFEHLKNNQDLYVLHPDDHWDLYKYTPAFSVFFGLFNALPDWLGLSLWNLLNALLLLAAVYYLPRLDNYQKGLVSLIILIELMTCMQNSQSNGLMAGLIVFSFGLLERNKHLWAAFCVVFSVFIKLFGIVAFALFLFYPQKWKSALYTVFWTVLLLASPLLLIDLDQYGKLYHSFMNILANDHDASLGLSVMGWLQAWFSVEVNKQIIVISGIVIFLLPFYNFRNYREYMFRYLLLCSILLWVIIFNHKAESPTFIIAMTGVALWFVKAEKNALNVALFISAFVLTTLSPTDLFPRYVRREFVEPLVLKAVPCILIWVKIIYDMLTLKRQDDMIVA